MNNKPLKILSALAIVAPVVMTGLAANAETVGRVPLGHGYAPGDSHLPRLNSRRDRLNGKADIYEAEIYRVERDRARVNGEIRRHILHDLTPGPSDDPGY